MSHLTGSTVACRDRHGRSRAARRVSKQTVYAHFADEQRLFTELIRAGVGQVDEPGHRLARPLGESEDVERDLCVVAARAW